jgi:hypothetical protein
VSRVCIIIFFLYTSIITYTGKQTTTQTTTGVLALLKLLPTPIKIGIDLPLLPKGDDDKAVVRISSITNIVYLF